MFEEPRLPEASNGVGGADGGVGLLDHGTSHHDGRIAGVDEALDEVEASLARALVQERHKVLARVRWLVLELYVGLSLHELEFRGDQEAERAVGPGDRVEQLWVFRRAALDELSVCQHHVVRHADVLEEAVLPRARLDSESGDQTSHRQIVQLGHDRGRQTQWRQM